MNVSYLPPDVLRKSVLDIIEACRKNLKAGHTDVSQVETSVKAYCEAIAALPMEEGKSHRENLQDLMQQVTELGEELMKARDSVKEELGRLENMRKAHAAYKTFDRIGKRKEDADD